MFKKQLLSAFAIVLAGSLAACGETGSLSDSIDSETGTITYTAEKATAGSALSGATVDVKEGDIVVVSPLMDKGALNVQLTQGAIGTEDFAEEPAVDEDFDGKVLKTFEVDPGEYTVTVSVAGNEATTGTLSVHAKSKADYEAENKSLQETVEEVSKSIEELVSDAKSDGDDTSVTDGGKDTKADGTEKDADTEAKAGSEASDE